MAGGGNSHIRPDLERIAKELAGSKGGYPINSFDELSQALGGDDTDVGFAGRRYRVGNFRYKLPSEIFPIKDEGDFIQKMDDLNSRGPIGQTGSDQQQQPPGPQPGPPPEPHPEPSPGHQPPGPPPVIPPIHPGGGIWC